MILSRHVPVHTRCLGAPFLIGKLVGKAVGKCIGKAVVMRYVRVLMVEDDHMQRSVLELLFEQANTHNDGFVNFEVKTVDSGLDALAEVRETAQANRQYDLILIDYVLGDMTGDTLIPHFRDLLGDSVAIVLTSIHSDARDRSLEMSADAFLHKPLSSDVISHIWMFLKDASQLQQLIEAGESSSGGDDEPDAAAHEHEHPSGESPAEDLVATPAQVVRRLLATAPADAPPSDAQNVSGLPPGLSASAVTGGGVCSVRQPCRSYASCDSSVSSLGGSSVEALSSRMQGGLFLGSEAPTPAEPHLSGATAPPPAQLVADLLEDPTANAPAARDSVCVHQ